MICTKCNQPIVNCICPDKEARLSKLGEAGSYVAIKFCILCNKHYALCKCEKPEFKMKAGGKIMELPAHASRTER